jgi:HEAT repeat protein
MIVDAMIGICVHDPDTLVQRPSVIRDWAARSLAGQLPGASLSADAKTGYIDALGAQSFEESERQAARDLPGQMREFMESNGLDPDAYQMRTYTDELRPNLKILVMAAVRREAPRAAPAPRPVAPPVPESASAKVSADALPSSETLDGWTEEIKQVDKVRSTWRGLGCGGAIVGVILVVALAIIFNDREPQPGWIGPVVVVGLVAALAGLVLFFVAGGRAKGAGKRLGEQIATACDTEGLSRPAVVEALWDRGTTGEIGKGILTGIEPETAALLAIRGRALEFFRGDESKISPIKINVSTSNNQVSSVTLDGEQAVDRWSAIALDYLDHGAYIESIAALATLQAIYAQIAPPGGEILLQAQPDTERLKQVSISAHKVFSGFDLSTAMKTIYETLTKRRTQSLVQILLTAQQGGQDSDRIGGAAEIDTSVFGFKDEAAVTACIDYLGKRTSELMGRFKAAIAMSFIPDERIAPYMLQAFNWMPFFPQGIDGLNRLGKSALPTVLAAFKTGSGSTRFNAGLTLGIIDAEGAAAGLAALYPRLSSPLERIGAAYALVRAGQADRLADVVAGLDSNDDNVRHGAAIALEHLPMDLADDIFLRHLNDGAMLVRLRLTRKLGAQGTDNLALWDALIARFEDSDENVRSAAANALGSIGGAGVYERMLALAQGALIKSRICAYQVLGKLSNAEAVPLLLDGLKVGADNDLRRAAITSLGELGAAEALDTLRTYFTHEELGGTTVIAVLQIGFQHKEAALKMLGRLGRDPRALLVRAMLGDERGKNQYKSLLRTGTDIQILLKALQYTVLLRDTEFEEPLSKLLKYRKHTNFPGDRYIGHLALNALVGIKLAKSAASQSTSA